jgi:hypothetical protein
MDLCLNTFVIQFPDDLLDTCLLTVCRALLLRYAHRRHCKDEEGYKEFSSHIDSLPEHTARSHPRLLGNLPPKISLKNYMSDKIGAADSGIITIDQPAGLARENVI